jgi:ubiquinone/menaquinone biosynthesis C-methylase UbiE
MDQIDKERFFNMAEAYDRMAQYLIPQYDFIQNEVLKLLSLEVQEKAIVVDLGAGSGIFLDRILSQYNNVKCYWVDYSDDFLAVAQKRLAKYNNSIQYILSTLEDSWEDKIPERADVIFSMSAIHHLEPKEKQVLSKRCYEMLNFGGWFINVDEMKTIYEEAHINAMRFWVQHVEESREKISANELNYYDVWKSKFDNWALRNIDNASEPKMKGDDIHEGFLEQLQWLKEAGFINVDLFIKYHLWSVIGGQKNTIIKN